MHHSLPSFFWFELLLFVVLCLSFLILFFALFILCVCFLLSCVFFLWFFPPLFLPPPSTPCSHTSPFGLFFVISFFSFPLPFSLYLFPVVAFYRYGRFWAGFAGGEMRRDRVGISLSVYFGFCAGFTNCVVGLVPKE